MKRFFNVFLLVLVFTFSYTSNGLAAPSTSPISQAVVPPSQPASLPTDQIIIKYKTSSNLDAQAAQAGQMQRLNQAAGVTLQYNRPMSGKAHILKLPTQLSLDQVQAIAARLAAMPDVEYAEADQIVQIIEESSSDAMGIVAEPAIRPLIAAPNDPDYAKQWHYFGPWGINAPTAWNVTKGLNTIVVAVIDTGITNHPEFVGRTVPGYDFISDLQRANDGGGRDANPSDPGDWCGAGVSSWHGTHVAGTIGASSNNGVGVAGINWQSKILPVRVLGKCGGSTSDVADGMRWAAGLTVSGIPTNPYPAKVINLSLGGGGACSATFQSAINAITAVGSVVVVASGNSSIDASGFSPANCNGVITVSATNVNGKRAAYSNFGSTVEISAPGGEMSASNDPNGVYSTINTGTTVPLASSYKYYQGTSMAAPHVSGVVSLLLSLKPALTPAQILQILQKTAKAFPAGGTNPCSIAICGAGIVDAGKAVQALKVVQFTSAGGYDGWVQESAQNSLVGGVVNATDDNFRLGDSVLNRQFRGILHFDTSALPDNAIIMIATLKIKKQSIAGVNPFTTFGGINLNIRKGAYTDNNALQIEDFQSPASLNTVGSILTDAPIDDWYSSRLISTAYPYINLTGPTQFRLRFVLDSNDNGVADHIKFFSGDSAYKPALIITYILP